MAPHAPLTAALVAVVVVAVLTSAAVASPTQFTLGSCSATRGYLPAAFNDSAAPPGSRRPNRTLEQCCGALSHKGTAVFVGSPTANGTTAGTCYHLGNLDHSLLVPGEAGSHVVTLDRNDPSPRSTSDIAVACFVGLYMSVAIVAAVVSMCFFQRTADSEHSSSTGVSGRNDDNARPLLSLPGPVPKAPGTLDSRPAQSVQQQRQLPTGIDDAEIGAVGLGGDPRHRIGDGAFTSGQHSLAGAVGRSSRGVDSTESEDGSDEGVGAADYRRASSAQFDERSSSPGFQRSGEQGAGSSYEDGVASDTTFGQSANQRRVGGGGGGGRRGPKESHPLFDKRTGAEYTKKYRFIRKLGEGSSSHVYLVRLRASYAKRHAVSLANPGELMAMKVMECATDEELQAAFTEYMSMKRLQGHPNIVELLDMTMATEDLPPDVQALQVSGSPMHPAAGRSGSGNGSGLPPRNFSTASSMDDLQPYSAESPARNDSSIVSPQRAKSPGYQASNSTESQHQQPMSNSNRGGGMPKSRFSASSLSSYGGGEDGTQSPSGFGRSRMSAARTAFTCLLMRFYPEGTLEGGVARDAAFFRRPSVVVTYTQQLLAALAFSHSHDIAHFDLKPANVLIQRDRQAVVVSDFGLARTMKRDDYANANAAAAAAAAGPRSTDEADHETGTEIGGGTLFFQAPEQLERRSSLRSDVWGAACTIVAMASGRVGAQTIPMFYWRAEADFHDMVRAAIADAALPPAFIELLLDMLAARPAERPRAEECLLRLATLVPEGLNVDTPADELYAAAATAARK